MNLSSHVYNSQHSLHFSVSSVPTAMLILEGEQHDENPRYEQYAAQ